MDQEEKKHKHKHKKKDKSKAPPVDEQLLMEKVKQHYGVAQDKPDKVSSERERHSSYGHTSSRTPINDSEIPQLVSNKRKRHGEEYTSSHHSQSNRRDDYDRRYDKERSYRGEDQRYGDRSRDSSHRSHKRYRDDETHGRPHDSDRKNSDHSARGCESSSKRKDNKREQSSVEEDVPVWDFPWENHRYIIDRVFFRDDDMIKR